MYQLIDSAPFVDYLKTNAKNSPLLSVFEIIGIKITKEEEKYKLVFLYSTDAKRTKDYYQNRVNNLFSTILNKTCDVEIFGDDDGIYDTPPDKQFREKERIEEEQREKTRHVGEVNRLYDLSRMPNSKRNKFTFDAYQCNKDNAKTLEIIKTYKNGFLTICGSTGLGKTHLAIAVGREFCKEEEYVMYYQVEELMDTLRHSYDQDNGESFTQKINELESQNLLILDDFGTQKNTDWVLSKLDTIIDCLYINEKNLIVTSNLSLKAMGEISPRIASRLSSGKVVTLVGNDYRTTHKEEGNGK
jgi:DNA replication protein DnaC